MAPDRWHGGRHDRLEQLGRAKARQLARVPSCPVALPRLALDVNSGRDLRGSRPWRLVIERNPRRRPVSGPAPETERERQLRALANRLLSWPDPEGPSTVDLMPLGYPDDLPSELVDYADLRFLGSVVRRREGELLGIQLLFEMAGDANDLLERYERSLLDLGWQHVNQPA